MSGSSKRAFVTGATGFLGYAIARCLLDAGHEVVLLTRTGSLPGELVLRGATAVHGDLSDRAALAQAMRRSALVFHVAADVNMWRGNWIASVETNVVGTTNAAEAARDARVERFVYTSSAATIGKPVGAPDGTIVDETAEYDLARHAMVYPHTKWLGERALEDVGARGLDTVVTHPAAIFGPWDWKHNLLPLFRAASSRAPLPIPDGIRTTCDVRDVARAHLVAAERAPTGAHYILGGEWVTVKELFGAIGRAVGAARPTVTVPDALILALGRAMDAVADVTGRAPLLSREMALQSTFRVRLSSAKAQRELQYRPRPLSESLADAVGWYRETGALR